MDMDVTALLPLFSIKKLRLAVKQQGKANGLPWLVNGRGDIESQAVLPAEIQTCNQTQSK